MKWFIAGVGLIVVSVFMAYAMLAGIYYGHAAVVWWVIVGLFAVPLGFAFVTWKQKQERDVLAGEVYQVTQERDVLAGRISALWALSEIERKALLGRLSGDKVEKIASDVGYSKSAIEKAIGALKEKGLLQ
jgi:hypothetical protein